MQIENLNTVSAMEEEEEEEEDCVWLPAAAVTV